MRAFSVHVISKRRLKGQKYHVQIRAGNGEILFWSENYRDLDYARELAHNTARRLRAGYIEDETL